MNDTATKLHEKKCSDCQQADAPLEGEKLSELKQQLSSDWKVIDGHHLHRFYTFDDFKKPLDFTRTIGEIAEEEGHHPTIKLTYGEVNVEIYTHKVDGLTESDFVLASKIEQAYSSD